MKVAAVLVYYVTGFIEILEETEVFSGVSLEEGKSIISKTKKVKVSFGDRMDVLLLDKLLSGSLKH